MASFIRPSFKAVALTTAGAGAAYQSYRYFSNPLPFIKDAYAESAPSDTQAILKQMQWKDFIELKLQSAEMYNHDVKRLTFALPDDQTVSGLSPISKL